MHLTIEQCWNGNNNHDCILQWMFRTRTIFFQYPNFHLPIYFGMSCWNYVVAGIVLIYTAPPPWFVLIQQQKWKYQFPYYTFIILLIFVQSPLSFLADYVYMDQDSIFHVIDRMIAVPLMTLELWKVSCLWWWCWYDSYNSNKIGINVNDEISSSRKYYHQFHNATAVVLYTSGTIMAVVSFLLSQESQSQQDIDGFILWHNRWHMYPLYASIVTLYDHYIQQLHHLQAQSSNSDHQPRPLFSSLQMIKLSTVSSSSSISSTATSTKEKDI